MTTGAVADVLALAMVAVACFHASRLLLALLWRRPTDYDVDIVHALMGVSMAGMLTGWLTGAWNDGWMLVFAASTVWFGGGLVRHLSDASASGAIAHHLPHFVASAVMLYMLWAMRWMSMSGGHMASMGGVQGTLPLPLVVATLVMANAAITAWRALSPGFQLAVSTPSTSPEANVASVSVASASSSASPVGLGRRGGLLAPRTAPACLLVMSVAMSYMLVTVHP